MLTCFGLTVVFDMVVSVTVGVVLAALLFMRRMTELSSIQLTQGKHPQLLAELPEGVLLYEVAGPLFFGAAEKAAGELTRSVGRARGVIIYLGEVPMIDMTGLVALESTITKLHAARILVVLAGVRDAVAQAIARGGISDLPQHVSIHRTLAAAEMYVRLAFPGHQADHHASDQNSESTRLSAG